MRNIKDLKYGSFSKSSPAEINELLQSEQKKHKLSKNNYREMRIIWLNLLNRDFDVEKHMLPFQEKYDNFFQEEKSSLTDWGELRPVENPYPIALLKTIYLRLYKLKQLREQQKLNATLQNAPTVGNALLLCAADQQKTDLWILKSEISMKDEDWFELAILLGCINIPKLFIATSWESASILNDWGPLGCQDNLSKARNKFYSLSWLIKCMSAGNLELIKFYLSPKDWEENVDVSSLRSGFTGFVAGCFYGQLILKLPLAPPEERPGSWFIIAIGVVLAGVFWGKTSESLSLVRKYLNSNRIDPYDALSYAIYSENKKLVEFFLSFDNNFGLSLSKWLDKTDININNPLILMPFLLDHILRDEKEFGIFFSLNSLDKLLNFLNISFPFYSNRFVRHLLIDPSRFERCIKRDTSLEVLAKHYPDILVFQKGSVSNALKIIRKSLAEIRKAGRLITLARKEKSHPFSSLPHELNIEVVSKTANGEVHDEESAKKIASDYIKRSP